MKRCIPMILVLVLALGSQLQQTFAGADKVHTVPAKGLKFEGEVTKEDAKVKVILPTEYRPDIPSDLHAKLYRLKLKAGRTYRLAMTSKAVDSVLVIQDTTGKQVAFDDDGGGYPDARLFFSPSKDDTYKVYAASLKGLGPFSLLVTDEGVNGNLPGNIHHVGSGLNFKGRLDEVTKTVPYQVRLLEGRTYLIDMSRPISDKLEPFLYLKDASGKKILAENDSFGKIYAQIVYTAKTTTTYLVEATSFQKKSTGSFTLTIRELTKGIVGKVHEIAGSLKFNNRLDLFTKTIPYQVRFQTGKTYVIHMSSPEKVEPVLNLKDSTGYLLTTNDSFGKLYARIVYRPISTNAYRIEATSYQGKGIGQFTLSIRELNQGILGKLDNGAYKAQGELALTDPKDELLHQSPHRVYSIPLMAGKNYTIDLESTDFDAFLRLEDASGNQLALDDDSGSGNNARIRFDAPRNETYRIIVTNVDRRAGNYSLTVRDGK
jgi:hypothetical protein